MAIIKIELDGRHYEGTVTEVVVAPPVTVVVSVPASAPAPELPPGNMTLVLGDDFEAGNLSKWPDSQVSPEGATLAATSGALRSFAKPGKKAEAGKEFTPVGAGTVLDFSGKYKVSRGAELNELYLCDLELSRSQGGDESESGPRLCIKNGVVCVERGKIGESTIRSTWAFPIDVWTTLRWRMMLGIGDRGTIQVWANGTKIIDTTGTNLPSAGKIGRCRVGNTINASTKDATVAVDDVTLHKG